MTDKELEAFRQYRSKLGVCLVPRDGVGGISCHESSGVCACYTDVLLTYAESLRAKLGEAEDRWKRYSDADTKAKIIARSIDVEEAYRVISKRAESAESKLAERDAEIAELKENVRLLEAAGDCRFEEALALTKADVLQSRLSVAVEALEEVSELDDSTCDTASGIATRALSKLNSPRVGEEGKLTRTKICESKLATRPLLYSDSLGGNQVLRDDLWAVSTEELNAVESEVVKLRESLRRAVEALNRINETDCTHDADCPSCIADAALVSLKSPAPPNPGEKEREAGA